MSGPPDPPPEREAPDLRQISAHVPFNAYLGIELTVDREEGLLARMVFRAHLVGNPAAVPKIISLTVDYLRPAAPEDTFASARVVKAGRRVAVVEAEAWQRDRGRLVASARAHVLVRRQPPPSAGGVAGADRSSPAR